MSYIQRKGLASRMRHRRNGGVVAMGDVSSVISSIGGAISTGAGIVNDPYFGELMCRLGQIRQGETGRPITPCQQVVDGLPSPGGLSKFMTPLRAYVYAEQNKWVFPVAAFAILGVPFLLGYMVGKD